MTTRHSSSSRKQVNNPLLVVLTAETDLVRARAIDSVTVNSAGLLVAGDSKGELHVWKLDMPNL